MKKAVFFSLVGFLFFLLYFAGCTGTSSGISALMGRWVSEEKQDVVVEFVKDGSGAIVVDGVEVEIIWTLEEDGKLRIRIKDLPIGTEQLVNYKISGSVLTLDEDKFVRKNKGWFSKK
jgi:hypothetical protein